MLSAFGVDGESLAQMERDVEVGLAHFKRICINIMVDNGTAVKRSDDVVKLFMEAIYPAVKDDPRVDVLLNNTDFGVG